MIAEGADVPAVIVVWTRTGGPDPEYHASGMAMAMDFVELILRWTRQVRLLKRSRPSRRPDGVLCAGATAEQAADLAERSQRLDRRVYLILV